MRGAPRVVVRRAKAADLDAVVDMRCALIEGSRNNPAYRRLREDYAAVARPLFAAQLADARCLTLIAVTRADAVGLLRCTLSGTNPLHHPSRHAYLVSVFVRPPHRRRGVLTALLRAAERWCSANGIDEMRVHVGVENATGNAAWESLGFEPAEVLRVRRIPSAGKGPQPGSPGKRSQRAGRRQ